MTKFRVTDNKTFTAAVLADDIEDAKQMSIEEYNSHKQDIKSVIDDLYAEEVVVFGFDIPKDKDFETIRYPAVIDMKYL